MPEIEIRDRNNNAVGTITLGDEFFAAEDRPDIVHEAITNYLANQRQGTHATKTRGLVSGGGKKPFKQKHTGRARAGSIRSPLWRSGGTTFGPQPRDYSYSLPKKVKRLALKTALSMKFSHNEVVIIDNLALEKPRTKEMVNTLETLGLAGKSVLIVLPEKNDSVFLSVRNIPGVDVRRSVDLHPYDILAHNTLLMTKEAVRQMESMQRI